MLKQNKKKMGEGTKQGDVTENTLQHLWMIYQKPTNKWSQMALIA